MLLLDFAVAYAHEAGLTVSAVHFNHHLRGAESDADEAFVRQRAQQLGIELHCSGADVAVIARAKKRNLESMARDLRYGFFFTLVRQGKLDQVATAHTANDQAETVLLRLIRGAGTRGLGGIHPVLEDGVVRPFLTITRAEVESEVEARGLAYRVDASNRETRFTRNRLRERILPVLERDFNPQVVESLAGFADRAREDEAFLEAQARDRSTPWLRREGGTVRIPARRLREFPPAIARRVLRRMVAEAIEGGAGTGGPFAISHSEMEALRRLAASGQSGKRMILATGVEARRDFEWLVIGRNQQKRPKDPVAESCGFCYTVRPPAAVEIPALRLRLSLTFADETVAGQFAVAPVSSPAVFQPHRAGGDTGATAKVDANEPETEYNTSEAVWLDPLNLAAPLTLRSWRAGDRFRALGNANPVKLKELFQRRRIPVMERAWWPILESAGAIVWVRGFAPASGGETERGKRLFIREELTT